MNSFCEPGQRAEVLIHFLEDTTLIKIKILKKNKDTVTLEADGQKATVGIRRNGPKMYLEIKRKDAKQLGEATRYKQLKSAIRLAYDDVTHVETWTEVTPNSLKEAAEELAAKSDGRELTSYATSAAG